MPEARAVSKIRAFVRDAPKDSNTRLSLSQMARQTGLSKWHFHRVFKKSVGVTPGEHLRGQPKLDQSWEVEDDLLTCCEDGRAEGSSNVWDTWRDEYISAMKSPTTNPTSTSDCTPWSIDDLLIWPEDELLT